MHILVLGSSGFIGGHLVKSLLDEGHVVYGADIRNIQHDIFTPRHFFQGDLRDMNFIESLFKLECLLPNKFDEVYQLAADMGGATYINCGSYDGSVMSNSVIINSNVAKCSVKYGIGKLFFASSACVYPHNDVSIASCNEDDVYPAFPDNEYGWEKLFSERMYKGFERQYGLNVRIARFHSVVGDYSVCFNDRSKAHSALAVKIASVEENGTIEVIGDGNQVRTFLYVKDCIQGIRKLMNSECKDVINIGSDVSITINEYINMLKQISGKQFNIQYIDGPTGVKTRYCSIENAKNKIQWEPTTSLEESTRITYKFVLDQLNLYSGHIVTKNDLPIIEVKISQKPVIKKNIGFITQPNGFAGEIKSSYCGIGIRGKLTSDILLKQTSDKYNFIVGFMNSNEELENFIAINQPEVLIYNYHSITTPFLNDPTLRYKYNNIKHVMIHYDIIQHMVNIFNPTNFLGFKYIITDNEKINNESSKNNVFKVTRSVPFIDEEILLNHAYQKDDIPKIGFQGFCSGCKLIENIAMKIQEEFDVAIFRIHSPPIFYGSEENTLQILENVKRIITKPGIKIEITREFLSDEEIIKWLHENTINCYFYFYGENAGIASSPDYAIAAKKPIVVNNSLMLMNLHGLTPSIEIEKSTIKQIIANGIEPLKPLYEKYDNKNVMRDYEKICDYVLDT